ncbi:hypothetical protein BU26DRAFT_569353 [Trematosphaeria pertusa]|uniref:Gamma-glutamylcyclotransferase AIG2-like domain-containing protein n=1 Tax=Trematosphaeria pertusa TaxID=390896 RepID=A0A6A6I1M7_9PLEO|nr:uncharacterized protein BU26DRAFT_569353 [Trematosphaeria pertusa]KAF2244365.1 hypothetical protein BU26DRAFT_569353 [Trematosphaeria pertusa]
MEETSSKKSLTDPYPIPYFLYDSLAEPKTLKRVQQLDDEPRLKQAQIQGYRRVRRGTEWVVVREDELRSPLPGKEGRSSEQEEEGVEGVVYVMSGAEEARRLEDYLRAEYGQDGYEMVGVEIEILAQGLRRARTIEGRTFLYTGELEAIAAKTPAKLIDTKPPAETQKKTKELKRKPLPLPSSSQSSGVTTLPRSPSLNLPTVQPRPACYHGASILGTQAMLSQRASLETEEEQRSDAMQNLSNEISVLYKEIKKENETTNGDLRRRALSSSSAISGISTRTVDGDVKLQEIDTPEPLFAKKVAKNETRRDGPTQVDWDSTYPVSPLRPLLPERSPMRVQWSFGAGNFQERDAGKPLTPLPEEEDALEAGIAATDKELEHISANEGSRRQRRVAFDGLDGGNGHEADSERRFV